MRGLIVLVVVIAACSKHEAPPPKVEQAPVAAPKPVPAPPPPSTPAGKLLDRTACATTPVPAASWVGTWNGSRPFDDANPMAHRGPTQVTITAAGDKLHVSEGVGAAKLETDVALEGDGIVASGQDHKTRTLNALSAETGKTSQITVSTDLSLAACFDASHTLHMWRVLDTSGTGIQSAHEEDDVVLSQ
jgi:hypothetical protein